MYGTPMIRKIRHKRLLRRRMAGLYVDRTLRAVLLAALAVVCLWVAAIGVAHAGGPQEAPAPPAATDAAATPAPEGYMLYAQVKEGSLLNVRERPATNAPVVYRLDRGDGVTAYDIRNGWAYVGRAGDFGWASLDFLTETPPESALAQGLAGEGAPAASGTGGGEESSGAAREKNGEGESGETPLAEEAPGDKTAEAPASASKADAAPTAPPAASGPVIDTNGRVRLRQKPDGAFVTWLNNGQKVTLLGYVQGKNCRWAHVRVGDRLGYVMSEYVRE